MESGNQQGQTTQTVPPPNGTAPSPGAIPPNQADEFIREINEELETSGPRVKWYAIGGGLAALVIFTLLTIGLYLLGDADQSALERLRDIAIIYVVLSTIVLVVLLAGITVALVYLIFTIRDQVIPLLKEGTATLTRIRGTTEFMTDEAVKPVISAAGHVAKWRAMIRVATGQGRK